MREATRWPALPYEAWQKTRDTLHMYMQVVGKLRLALSPFEPEWAHVALYVTPRGLTTSAVPAGARTIDAEFDFIDHALVIRDSDGHVERRPLGGSVAEFYHDVMRALQRMQVEVAISTLPSEVSNPIRFPEDRVHDTYDPQHAARFHHALLIVDGVMKEHRARFRGRCSAVHFFWGTFDLALSRYSGRPAEPAPGAGTIMRVSEDAEQICAGWWPGDERLPFPAFYAYAYPAPEGIAQLSVQPRAAAWSAEAGYFLLPYDAVISEVDPRRAVLDFLESTYAGAARLGDWDRALTEIAVPVAPA